MYLITGGAGFIGASLAEALVNDGERVRIFDDFSTGSMDNLAGFADKVEIVKGDLRDLDGVRRAMQDVHYVSHQAALRSVPRSVDDPLSSDDVNTHGTLHVLVAAREAKVRRVVTASSSSVYGESPTLPKVEDQPTRPISPYAVSKLAGELYGQVFTRLYRVETVGLRYFNVFGPKQSPESKYAAVVPLFIRSALRGEPLEVHGDGEQSRDFTYIDNVVLANRLSFVAPNAAGEAFNIACGERYSLMDIVRSIENLLDRKVAVNHTATRAGDVRHTLASIEKAQRLLNYQPTISFAEGMRRTVASAQAAFAAGTLA